MTPRDVDCHSFRDLRVMLDAAREREARQEREAWRRSLIQVQAIMNMMSKKPKPLSFLADKLLAEPLDAEEKSDVRRRIREAHELAMKRAEEKANADAD